MKSIRSSPYTACLVLMAGLSYPCALAAAENGENAAKAALHYRQGTRLLQQHQMPAAITELRAATEMKPDFAEAFTSLGIALEEEGQLEAAIEQFQRAVKLEPH